MGSETYGCIRNHFRGRLLLQGKGAVGAEFYLAPPVSTVALIGYNASLERISWHHNPFSPQFLFGSRWETDEP
jgi:hypothetical protein